MQLCMGCGMLINDSRKRCASCTGSHDRVMMDLRNERRREARKNNTNSKQGRHEQAKVSKQAGADEEADTGPCSEEPWAPITVVPPDTGTNHGAIIPKERVTCPTLPQTMNTEETAETAAKGLWGTLLPLHEIEVLYGATWQLARVVARGDDIACEVHIAWLGSIGPGVSREQTIHLAVCDSQSGPPWQVRRGWPHLRVACIYSALGADATGVALSGRATVVYATDVNPDLHLQFGVNKALFPVTLTENNDLQTPGGRAKDTTPSPQSTMSSRNQAPITAYPPP
jgi:hypothetical protein